MLSVWEGESKNCRKLKISGKRGIIRSNQHEFLEDSALNTLSSGKVFGCNCFSFRSNSWQLCIIYLCILFVSVLGLVQAHKGIWKLFGLMEQSLEHRLYVACSSPKRMMTNICGPLSHEKSALLVEASSKETVNTVNILHQNKILGNNCGFLLQHYVRFAC